MSRVAPNSNSVQIISPSSGLTRKRPPLSSSPPPPPFVSWAMRRMLPMSAAKSISEEEGDEAEDERVERNCLDQREAEPLDAGDLLAHLGLARDRLDHAREEEPEPDAGADRPQSGADAERDRLQTVVGDAWRLLGDWQQQVEHVNSLLRQWP